MACEASETASAMPATVGDWSLGLDDVDALGRLVPQPLWNLRQYPHNSNYWMPPLSSKCGPTLRLVTG